VLWLTGGQALTSYAVTVNITTVGGRALARSIALPVAALAAVTVTAATLTTQSGQPLTDPTGTPLTTL
jgi:purine nucleoside phosphorylase